MLHANMLFERNDARTSFESIATVIEPIRHEYPEGGTPPLARVYFTTASLNRMPAGLVYASRDNHRLIYTPLKEDGSGLWIDEASYMQEEPFSFAGKIKDGKALYDDMGGLQKEPLSYEDKQHVLCLYHGAITGTQILNALSFG